MYQLQQKNVLFTLNFDQLVSLIFSKNSLNRRILTDSNLKCFGDAEELYYKNNINVRFDKSTEKNNSLRVCTELMQRLLVFTQLTQV